MSNPKITERGWAGHFCHASKCGYRRNTLVEVADRKVVISSIGAYRPTDGEVTPLGNNRFYETCAFEVEQGNPYDDADPTKELFCFESECGIFAKSLRDLPPYTDKRADDMHEAVVAEFVKGLQENQEFGR